MYPTLCGEELEPKSYTAPPWGVPISQTPQAGPEGLGCIRRCVGSSPTPTLCGEELEVQSMPTSPYPPNGAGRTGGTPPYHRLSGEELETQSYTAPSRGVPISQTAEEGPEELGCMRPYVGRSWKCNHT